MKRVLLLAVLGALGVAGAAYAASINTYNINATVTPTASGTNKKPKPVTVGITFTVATNPLGTRPFPVVAEKTSYAGLRENTTFFPGCSTSTLTNKSPSNCPRGSLVGSGALIFSVGPTGNNAQNYSVTCQAAMDVFNGGHHNLILYVFNARPGSSPAPCPVPGGHVVINSGLSTSGGALNQNVPIPQALLHPTPTTEASLVASRVNMPKKSKTKKINKHKSETIGLIQSVSCAPNHQRQIAMTFKDSTGNSRRATDLVHCTGGQNQTRRHGRHH